MSTERHLMHPQATLFPMHHLRLMQIFAAIGVFCFGGGFSNAAEKKTAVDYLTAAVDAQNSKLYVYNDLDDGLNRYPLRALMSGNGSVQKPEMEEGYPDAYSGVSSIKVTAHLGGDAWMGYTFESGKLAAGSTSPEFAPSGPDLRGASVLKFRAKGATGGEQVKFYMENAAGGQRSIGSSGYVSLTSQWVEYEIPLNSIDLEKVTCGFAWVTSSLKNQGKSEIVFYLDDIRYEFSAPRNTPFFLRSYEPKPGKILNGFSYVYDNAVSIIALVRGGKIQQARLIADALVYAVNNDRYYADGRLRNAYANGNPASFPDWNSSSNKPFARMPGFTSPDGTWLEDFYASSTSTGNVAWGLLAFCEMAEREGDADRKAVYLAAAKKLAAFALTLQDTAPGRGFFAGYQGFEDKPQTRVSYKSTEHNIDLISAFRRLSALASAAGDTAAASLYADAAGSARDFVLSMYDTTRGGFDVGTKADGVTPDTGLRVLDVNTWAIAALSGDTGADVPDFAGLFNYIENNFAVGGGYDFNNDKDGVWHEGTAQAAVAFALSGKNEKYGDIVNYLNSQANADGSIAAARKVVSDGNSGVTTGITLEGGTDESGNPVGNPWFYDDSIHVGATAWLALAQGKANPFAPAPQSDDNTDPGNTDPGNTDPGNTDPGNTDPGNTDPGNTDPGNTDPGNTDPGNTDPGNTDPGNTNPGNTDPGNTDPGVTDPGNADPGNTDPGNTDPGNTDPGVTDPGNTDPGNSNPGNIDTDITDPWEPPAVVGLSTKGAKLDAPKDFVVPKGTKLASGTKAVYTWTDATGRAVIDSKGKPFNGKSYTAKAPGEYTVTFRYTPIDPVSKAALPEVVRSYDFGKVKIFIAPKIASAGGFTAEPVTTATGVANSVVQGETLRLTVRLEPGSGTGPLNYIWLKGKEEVARTRNTYALTDTWTTAAFGEKADAYTVVVETVARDPKNAAKPLATVKSKALKPKVILKPSVEITTPAAKRLNVAPGKTVSLTAKAKGTAKLDYHWEKDGVPLPGANKASFKAVQSGQYTVRVTNPAGEGHAASATVAVTFEGSDVLQSGSLALSSGGGAEDEPISSNSSVSITGIVLGDGEPLTASEDMLATITVDSATLVLSSGNAADWQIITLSSLAPFALEAGAVFVFEDGGELAILSDSEIPNGTYNYERLTATTARLSYILFAEDGAIETGEILLDFTATRAGSYEWHVDADDSPVSTGGFVLTFAGSDALYSGTLTLSSGGSVEKGAVPVSIADLTFEGGELHTVDRDMLATITADSAMLDRFSGNAADGQIINLSSLAPFALEAGTALVFEDGGELATLSDSEIPNGSYNYERLTATTARLSYILFAEDGAIETGEILLGFAATGTGSYEWYLDADGSPVATGGFVLE